jgi:subtilisin family serine protease
MTGRANRGLVAALLALVGVLLGSTVALATNDPGFPQQWGLTGAPASANAPQAWCATGGGTLVADVDTGADFGHPDLGGKLIPGAAFLNGTAGATGSGPGAVQDGHGHGTMTTGLMVANTNNGVGIAAVAPSSQALIVKVLDNSGAGYGNDVAAGIRYAVDRGAKVINLSVGSDLPLLNGILGGNPIPGAIDYAYQRGAMVAAAAGNTWYAASDYNSVASEALVVGAVDRNGNRAGYSTTGNIYAPGGDGNTQDPYYWVLSTVNGGSYGIGAGTSFAAPHVAGTLALLMSHGFDAAGARARILQTAASRNGLPELDAAAALGTSNGCPGTPPVGATTGAGPGARGLGIRALGPGRGNAAQSSTPGASPSPSASPSPVFNVVPNNSPDVAPGSVLAKAPPNAPDVSPVLVAALGLLGVVLGYGGAWGLMLALRMRAAQAGGSPTG